MTPREIDIQVAEKVMGHFVWWRNETPDIKIECDCVASGRSAVRCPAHGELRYYSADIAAAWEVAQYLTDHHYLISIRAELGLWGCRTENPLTGEAFQIERESAPRAVCLAALKAVGVEVPA